jgi:hypothetical protein
MKGFPPRRPGFALDSRCGLNRSRFVSVPRCLRCFGPFRVSSLAVFFLFALAVHAAMSRGEERRNVSVRQTALRGSKATYSPRIATLKEGDSVLVLGGDGPWLHVTHEGLEGWILEAEVSPTLVIVCMPTPESVPAPDRSVSAAQLLRARRGSLNLEHEYQHSRPECREAWELHRNLERDSVPDERIVEFRRAGLLCDPEGSEP